MRKIEQFFSSTLLNCVLSNSTMSSYNTLIKMVRMEVEEDHKRLLDDVLEAVEVTSATQLVEGDQTKSHIWSPLKQL